MALQIQYSKEIAEQLGKVAVYFPGEEIEVGDIIKFPYGRVGLFSKKVPFGSFTKVSSLKNLGVKYNVPKYAGQPDSYQFTSKNSVKINSSVKADITSPVEYIPKGNAGYSIQFCSEGAIFFLAVDCRKKQLDDILVLEQEINSKGKDLLWTDTYLVTSVTIARKAFIAQSKSKESEIILQGSAQGFASKIDVNIKFEMKEYKGDVFIKDWSDDVSVFMELVKFEREVFEKKRGLNNKSNTELGRIVLKKVNVNDLIEK